MYIYDCDYCGEKLLFDSEIRYLHGVPVHILVECRWMNHINRDQVLRQWAVGLSRYSAPQPPLF